MSRLFTIGYEGATPNALADALANAGVETLIDVRAVANSRRPGFSKRALAAGLEERGVGYLHMRALGTPADGRAASRSGRYDDMRRIYEAHLQTEAAKDELTALEQLVRTGKRLCLLCFEREPEHCHRLMIAERVEAADADVAIEHLHPLPATFERP
ncbi:DUF488 family protein [Hansschlegelia beijingensis]|uniref:DUF488 domain-containing protein n=1 Tax=Hansschlegelia beijingensis TaxID=1133344 RepID=UPI00387EF551